MVEKGCWMWKKIIQALPNNTFFLLKFFPIVYKFSCIIYEIHGDTKPPSTFASLWTYNTTLYYHKSMDMRCRIQPSQIYGHTTPHSAITNLRTYSATFNRNWWVVTWIEELLLNCQKKTQKQTKTTTCFYWWRCDSMTREQDRCRGVIYISKRCLRGCIKGVKMHNYLAFPSDPQYWTHLPRLKPSSNSNRK